MRFSRWKAWLFAAVAAASGFVAAADAQPAIGTRLPAWAPGELDIHQLSFGGGNAALVIAPDGTTILIDAGAGTFKPGVTTPARPDASRRPGQWIARYVQRHLPAEQPAALDYFVATHLHPDHLGDVTADSPVSRRDGSYALSGITDVAESLPIARVIDRGYPDYDYPSRWTAPFAQNYIAFIRARERDGQRCEHARVGSADQVVLRRTPAEFPNFEVCMLAANGEVWTGHGAETKTAVPPLNQLTPSDYPDENMCSLALRISYGAFRYFSGGDLHCDTRFGQQPWRDIETPAAKVAGPVDVAVADHHGYFDAVGAESVRALQPRVWVVPAWHITHLNIAVAERMLSERLYAGPRDVFVTDLLPATKLIDERFIGQVKSTSGHIVIRVSRGGQTYRVFVTENRDESDVITGAFGPYQAR